LKDIQDRIDDVILDTDQQAGISGPQKRTGGADLGKSVTGADQLLCQSIDILILHDGNDKFHFRSSDRDKPPGGASPPRLDG
jgi:hypothetical protein